MSPSQEVTFKLRTEATVVQGRENFLGLREGYVQRSWYRKELDLKDLNKKNFFFSKICIFQNNYRNMDRDLLT